LLNVLLATARQDGIAGAVHIEGSRRQPRHRDRDGIDVGGPNWIAGP